MRNKIILYNPLLKEYARQLRNNSTLAEVLLWQKIKQKSFGVQFHRQIPLLEYIVDFYCHELLLAIEIDGDSHDHKYDDDAKRQGLLERQGVTFIRFSDSEIKNDMFSVLMALEDRIHELVVRTSLENTPKMISVAQSRLELSNIESSFSKSEKTPLKSPQGDNTFGKKEKLKSKKRIAQLFEEGKVLTVYPLKLIYLKGMEQPSKIQAAVAVPKKNFKSAVARNRIKRLLRESYRLNKAVVFNNTQGEFAFLFLYLGKETPTFQELQHKMKSLLQKFNALAHEKTS